MSRSIHEMLPTCNGGSRRGPASASAVRLRSANSSLRLASVVRGEKSTEDGGGVLCSAGNSSWETKMEKKGNTPWNMIKSSKEDT